MSPRLPAFRSSGTARTAGAIDLSAKPGYSFCTAPRSVGENQPDQTVATS